MFINISEKQAAVLIAKFNALLRLLALCLFMDISIFKEFVF